MKIEKSRKLHKRCSEKFFLLSPNDENFIGKRILFENHFCQQRGNRKLSRKMRRFSILSLSDPLHFKHQNRFYFRKIQRNLYDDWSIFGRFMIASTGCRKFTWFSDIKRDIKSEIIIKFPLTKQNLRNGRKQAEIFSIFRNFHPNFSLKIVTFSLISLGNSYQFKSFTWRFTYASCSGVDVTSFCGKTMKMKRRAVTIAPFMVKIIFPMKIAFWY